MKTDFLLQRSSMLLYLLLFALLMMVLMRPSDGVSKTSSIFPVTVVENLEHPWAVAFLPNGDLLITERPGRLRLVRDGVLLEQPVGGLPEIAAVGQGGLLDVVLHPDYAKNGWIYVSYVGEDQQGIGTEVLRGKLQGNQLVQVEILFRMLPKSNTGHHFGSRLIFDRDNFLYITLGDRGDRPRAQRLDDHAGSVIRLLDDGRIPKDNPYVGQADKKPEIFSYGHRNQQGGILHPQTGEIWTHEHGPQGGDELNIIQPGVNYGWPVITYGVNYVTGTKIGEGTAKAGMQQPIHYWVPSIAPSGMAIYTGDQFPEWQGDLFIGSLKFQQLVRLTLDGNKVVAEERLLTGELGRIRDVRNGPDGYLYLLTDAGNGKLIRLERREASDLH